MEETPYISSYSQWLSTLGYSESTVYYNPVCIHWFLDYAGRLDSITGSHIENYINQLKTRKHRRRNGTLSNVYINKQISILRNFNKYLGEVHGKRLPLDLTQLQEYRKPITILTPKEIKQLFEVTENSALGLRDRAMLSIYYGCGLRRTEGEQLNISDINTKENVLLVRKAKNGKQRLVPFTENTKTELLNYLHYARPLLDKSMEDEAYFLSRRGSRATAGNMYCRLKSLAEKATIRKNIGLHTLRHSIATHLLQSGMKLEYISRFLGHSTLESTQLYTHIVNEL